MAAPLKDRFGPDAVRSLADWLHPGDSRFDADSFVAAAVVDLESLELKARVRAVADALLRFLPADPAAALAVVEAATTQPRADDRPPTVGEFTLWPVTMVVADLGPAEFDRALALQRPLTRLFTCEFSIRRFLTLDPERALAALTDWTADPDEHVRRLVSEGTRPRLPWAERLPAFVADPAPVVPLLTRLVDDPSEYVRRSVANNLNDISRDHPDVALATAAQWLGAEPRRRRVVRHGLRTLLKRGDHTALALLGHDPDGPVRLIAAEASPARARIGHTVALSAQLENPGGADSPVQVEFEVSFPRATGRTAVKVFRGPEVMVPAGARRVVRRSVSLRQLSTRVVHPGRHAVVVIVNGTRSEPRWIEVEAGSVAE